MLGCRRKGLLTRLGRQRERFDRSRFEPYTAIADCKGILTDRLNHRRAARLFIDQIAVVTIAEHFFFEEPISPRGRVSSKHRDIGSLVLAG